MAINAGTALYRVLIAGALIVALVVVLRLFWPTQYKVFRYNFSGISDYLLFDRRALLPASQPLPLPEAPSQVQRAVASGLAQAGLEDALRRSGSVAVLILRDGKRVYEWYGDGFTSDTPVMIYSITKSVLSLLIGLAIEDGLIQSVDQPVGDFLPAFRRGALRATRIRHLLQMTSGLPYREGAINNPFGLHAHLSYTDNIAALLQSVSAGDPPGTRFAYKSVDYALLGQLLDAALGGETLTGYLRRKLWAPLGAGGVASWSIDSRQYGLEKSWCCLAMTARDLSRFGLLMMDRGQWQGRRLVPGAWVDRSLSISTHEGSIANYQYGWWLMPGETFAFRGEGILGQFLYVNPANRIVIVRLGSGLGQFDWRGWRELLTSMADVTAGAPVLPGSALGK